MKLKAYKLCCDDDEHGAIIRFAERGSDLRGFGTENCDCPYIECRVLRAKEFDQFAPGPVTIEQYLSMGWWWTCSGCGEMATQDEHPIIIEDNVYHDVGCVVEERRHWPRDVSRHHESVQAQCRALDDWLYSFEAAKVAIAQVQRKVKEDEDWEARLAELDLV